MPSTAASRSISKNASAWALPPGGTWPNATSTALERSRRSAGRVTLGHPELRTLWAGAFAVHRPGVQLEAIASAAVLQTVCGLHPQLAAHHQRLDGRFVRVFAHRVAGQPLAHQHLVEASAQGIGLELLEARRHRATCAFMSTRFARSAPSGQAARNRIAHSRQIAQRVLHFRRSWRSATWPRPAVPCP